MEEGGKEQIESPQPADKPDTKNLAIAWTVSTGLGWLTGLIGMVFFVWESFVEYFAVIHSQGWDPLDEPGLYIALAGFVACALQGLVLRGRLAQPGRRVLAGGTAWILASGIAWGLAILVIAAPSGLDVDALPLWLPAILAGLVAGAMVGATQWLVVREKASRAGLWIVASAVGWGLAMTPWSLLSTKVDRLDLCLFHSLSGFVAGAVMGPALARCLRQPPGRPVSLRRAALLVGLGWLLVLAAALAALTRR